MLLNSWLRLIRNGQCRVKRNRHHCRPQPACEILEDRALLSTVTVNLAPNADTRIHSGNPTTNFGTSSTLQLDGNPDIASLIRWNLATIPQNSAIQSADLTLSVTQSFNASYEIYKVLRPWTETQATFNNASTTVAWQVAGAQGANDRDTAVLGTVTATTTGAVTFQFNAAGIAAIQSWVNQPAANFGLVIQDYGNTADLVQFRSREDGVVANRPTLRITYTNEAPTAVNDFYSILPGGTIDADDNDIDGVLLNDTDPENNPLTATLVAGPANGTLTFEPDGQFLYQHNGGPSTTDSFTYRVSDGPNVSNVATVTITIGTPNTPPTVSAGPDVSITVGQTASLDGTVTDDGKPTPPGALTFSWTKLSGPGTVTFGNASAVDTAATFSSVGNYVLQLTTSDGQYSVSDIVTVFVLPAANQAPVVDAGPNQSINFGQAAALDGTAGDDGRPSILFETTWSVVSGPGTVTFGNAAAVDTTATFSAAGTYVLRLTGSDLELSSSDTVSIVVNAVNQPPIVDAGPNRTINMSQSASLVGTVTDDGLGTPPGTLATTWSVSSGPGTVTFANASAVDTTATFSAIGTYVLRLTAGDGQFVQSDTMTVVVTNNQAPTAVNDFYSTQPGGHIDADDQNLDGVLSNDTDPENDNLTATLVNGPTHGTLTFRTDGRFEYRHDGGPSTADSFTYRASDGSNTGNVATVSIIIERPPTVNAGSDQTITLENSASLDGTVSDDGFPQPPGAVTTTWSLLSGPGTATFGNVSEVDTTASFSAAGTYVLQLAANDGQSTSSDTITITVHPTNIAPSVDAGGNQTITLDNSATLDGTVTDDGWPQPPGAVTTTWSQVSGPGTAIFGNSAAVDTTVSFSAAGTYVLQLSANDGQSTVSDMVTITVQPTNVAPGVDAGGNQSITIDNSVTLDGTVTDDGWPQPPGALTITWSQLSGPGTATFGNSSAVDTSVSFSAVGTYVLQLSASDSQYTTTDTVTITVNPTNVAPSVEAGENQTITLENSATLDATVNDDGLPLSPGAVTTTWSQISGPGTATFGDASAVDTTASFSVVGTYILQLSANDGQDTTADTVTITVHPTNVAPGVDAGGDQTITLESSATLDGTVTDDGWPQPPSAVTTNWSQISGPGTATFGDSAAVDTTVSFSATGTYILQLSANDGQYTNTDAVTITVHPTNVAPSVDAGGDTTITLENSANLNGTVNDDGWPQPPGAVTTTWSQISGPGTATFGDASAIDTAVSFGAAGTYVLQLSANDGQYTITDTVTITVHPTNVAPSVDAGNVQTITLENSASLDGTVTDDGWPQPPGAVTSAWSLISGPGTATFGNSSAVDTTVSFSAAGTYVLQLSANDGQYAITDPVTIIVHPTNIAPVVNAGPDQTGLVTTNHNFQDGLNGYAGTTDTYMRLTNPTQNFGVSNPIHVDGSPQEASLLRWDISTIPAGSVVNGVSISLNLTNDTTEVYEIYQVLRSWSESQVTWSQAATGENWGQGGAEQIGTDRGSVVLGTLTTNASGLATINLNAAGVAVVQGWVNNPTSNFGFIFSDLANTDNLNFSSREDAVVANRPKLTVDYYADLPIELGQTATLNGTVTDDGWPQPPGAITTSWSQISGPGTVTFGDASAVDTTANLSALGTYVLQLSATDGQYTTTDTITIQVNPVNVAPTVDAGLNQTTEVGLSATLDGTVSDDGLPQPPAALTATWSQLSGPGVATFGNASSVDTTVSFSAAGTYVLRLAVSDGEFTVTDTVTYTVNPANTAPVVDAGSSQSIAINGTLNLDGTVTDDGWPQSPGTVTTTWSALSGPGIVAFGNTSTVDTTATFSLSGTYVLRLSASDGQYTTTDTVTITVTPPNSAPVVEAGTNQTIGTTQSASLNGTVMDDGLPASPGSVTTTWSKLSGPGTVTFGDASAVDTTASFSAAGTYVLQLMASDGQLTNSDTVTIDVVATTTTSFQQGVNSYSGMIDTFIEALDATQNNGNNSTLEVDGSPDEAALFKWDISTIPTGSPVISASITLDTSGNTTHTYELYELLRIWTENGATWNQFASGTNWGTAGANQIGTDRNSTVLGTWTSPNNGFVTFNLNAAGVAVVQSWVNNPANNHGVILLDYSDATSDSGDISSSEDGTVANRPRLTINYVPVNQAPQIDAGSNQTISVAQNASLNATVTDDGLPTGSSVTTTWSVVSGPGTVVFANTSAVDTAASFDRAGSYVLQLLATDGTLSNTDTVTITVTGVSFQEGVNGYTGMIDSFLRQSSASSNFGTATTLELDGNPDESALLKWDLGSVPVGTTLTGASITLNITSTSSDSYELYQVLRNWTETGVTWNQFTGGSNWQTAGAQGAADRGTTVLGSVTSNSTGLVTFNLNAAGIAVVQGWINNPATNFGFALQDYADATGDDLNFASSETGTAANRPRLTLEYVRTNAAPTVDAGADAAAILGQAHSLNATVSDDGWPVNPGSVTTSWSVVSGSGTVTFGNSSAVDTTASFSSTGTYVLQLSVTDGTLTTTDTVTITVSAVANLQQGVNGYSGMIDTWLEANIATQNNGNDTTLELDGSPDEGILMRWDTTSVPTGSVVTSASIMLNVTNTTGDTIELYEALRNWTETGATWNQFAGGSNWQTAGAQGAADRGTTVLGTFTAPSTGLVTINLNAAGVAVVQAWVDNPSMNRGFALQDYANSSGDSADISSSETGTAANRPRLTINFSSGSPLRAAGVALNSQSAPSITTSDAENLMAEAEARLESLLGKDVSSAGYTIRVVDLAGDLIGYANGNTIYLDINAAGHGWFVDSTPYDDSEFTAAMTAAATSEAAGRIDLLSVLAHELGHLNGLEHESSSVMTETVDVSSRLISADRDTPSHVACALDQYFTEFPQMELQSDE